MFFKHNFVQDLYFCSVWLCFCLGNGVLTANVTKCRVMVENVDVKSLMRSEFLSYHMVAILDTCIHVLSFCL